MPAPITPTWALVVFALSLALRLGVGVWILRRARATHGFAELVLGAFVVLLTLGEIAAVSAARLRGGAGEPGVWPLSVLGVLLIAGGHAALAVATQRIFRASDRWARGVAWGLAALLVAASVVRLLRDAQPSVMADPTAANLVLLVVRLATDLWWAGEASGYGRRIRRQAALGLADASLARRCDLWAISGFGHATILVLLLWCALVLRVPASAAPISLAIMACAGLISVLAIQASFRPPRAAARDPLSDLG